MRRRRLMVDWWEENWRRERLHERSVRYWKIRKTENRSAGFHRITKINLKHHFYAVLDQHISRLLSSFRKKAACTGKVAKVFAQLFRMHDLQMAQSNEPDVGDVPLGLLVFAVGSTHTTFFCPGKIAVVLEGKVVFDFPTVADVFVMLFALTCTLHLSYLKELANTFDFFQKVLMGLEDGKMRPREYSVLKLTF